MKISKTDFLLLLDNPIHFWAYLHEQCTPPAPSLYEQHLMKQGIEVEKMAEDWLLEKVVPKYQNAGIEFQETWSTKNFEARVDAIIYDRENQVYDIFEIKSSPSAKKEHIWDAAFQKLICEEHIPVRDVYLVHPDKEYVQESGFNLGTFFKADLINEEINNDLEKVVQTMQSAVQIANMENADGLSPCRKPSSCPCLQLCHPELPEFPIYEISRLHWKKADKLREDNILAIRDIPSAFQLSDKQQIFVNAVKSGKPNINHTGIKDQLEKLVYPLNFLDYETFNPAVPLFNGYKPFQHIVFQYSLHIKETPTSELKHFEWLSFDETDPAKETIQHLQQHLEPDGSVIVWNKAFEAGRNVEIADRLPEFSSFLNSVNENIFDIMEIFSKGLFVHPEFHGSASIKKVLPVLCPDFTYEGLAVSNGEDAMLGWRDLKFKITAPENQEQLKKDLLYYCNLDTLAMVKIWEYLMKLT